jgi:ubiquinone/menaquinone biosynthesis C-methylase UbiE
MAMIRGNYAVYAPFWGLGGPGRLNEIEFYSVLAKKYGTKVLSLMCATGEIAVGMAGNGLRVTAVDIESEMITTAKKNNHGITNPVFMVGDIMDINLADNDFDFSFIGTGDFHHLLSIIEMEKALKRINYHLSTQGGLVLELFYPQNQSWQSPRRKYEQPNLPQTGPRIWRVGESSYNSQTMREHIRQKIFIEEQGKVEGFLHEFDLQLISRETLTSLLESTGFQIITEYGSFDFDAWQPGADKWFVECIKQP